MTRQQQRTNPRPALLSSCCLGRHRRAEGGHPWIYSNEVRMDAAAKALAPGSPRHAAPRRRQPARGRDVQPAHPARRTLAGPRCRPADRPPLFRPPARAGAPPARADVRCALLSPRPCRSGRASGSRRRPVRGGPRRSVEHCRDGPPRASGPRCAGRAAGAGRRSCCATTARPARSKGCHPKRGVARGIFEGSVCRCQRTAPSSRPICSPGRRPAGSSTSATTGALSLRWPQVRGFSISIAISGGFAVRAAHAGAAAVLGIDRSEPALALAAETARRNGVAEICRFRRAEAFGEAARLAAAGERFDIVDCRSAGLCKIAQGRPGGVARLPQTRPARGVGDRVRRHLVPRLLLVQCRRSGIRRVGAARARRCRPQRPHHQGGGRRCRSSRSTRHCRRPPISRR